MAKDNILTDKQMNIPAITVTGEVCEAMQEGYKNYFIASNFPFNENVVPIISDKVILELPKTDKKTEVLHDFSNETRYKTMSWSVVTNSGNHIMVYENTHSTPETSLTGMTNPGTERIFWLRYKEE